MTERPVLKAIFMFLAGLPLGIFRVGYFVFTLPKRLRRRRAMAHAPLTCVMRAFGQKKLPLLSAVALIGQAHDEAVRPSRPARPGVLDLLEALWAEDEVEAWRLPMVREVHAQSEQFAEALSEGTDTGQLTVWAIDEDSRMFVVVDVRHKRATFAHPERLMDAFWGQAPDSLERAYPVAVRIERRSTTRTPPL